MSKDVNVVALVKGEERFIFLFNDKKKSEMLRTLGKYASNSDLNFSWYDAAVLSQKVRNATKEPKNPAPQMPVDLDLPPLGRGEISEFGDFMGEEPIW